MWSALKKHLWQRRGVFITIPTVAGVVIGLRFTGLLQMLELATLDQFFLMRPIEAVDPRIVIVQITEADVQKADQWPISDATLAQLLTTIKQQQPSAIGLDIYRDKPVSPGYAKLKQVFTTTPNLVGVQKVAESFDGSSVAPPLLLKQRDQVGSNDLPFDSDGKIRRGLLYVNDKDNNTIFSFSFKLAFLHLKKQGIESGVTPEGQINIGSSIFPAFESNDGGYMRAQAEGYQTLLNYRGQIQRFQTISMAEVLNNRIPASLMRDRIVLIGGTAESLKDTFYTPYSSPLFSAPNRMPGVAIHANLISQLLSTTLDHRPLIKTYNESLEWMWIVGWTTIGATLSWTQRNVKFKGKTNTPWLAGSAVLAVGSLIVGSYAAFLQGWWLPVIPPLLGLSGASIVITAYIARTASEIRRTFGRYLTDQVVASLLESPEGLKIGGERRKITILTSDLRGFTATSERLPPEEVVKILNIYLEAMTDVITTYRGTIDEFMGDGILVLFGAPTLGGDDAARAVACAISMQLAIAPVNEKLQQLGWAKLEMGIGINTGEVVVGNIGSEKRTKYSVIGNHVNLTYRIESFTVGGQILISDSTYQEIAAIVNINHKNYVQAKGLKEPIAIYDVSGIDEPFNLVLTKEEEILLPLLQSIPLQYVALDGKHIDDTMVRGSILKLSARGAEIQSHELIEMMPAPLTNIKLNVFFPDESIASDDIYAKVLTVLPETNCFHAHFTAKNPQSQLKLDQLYRSLVDHQPKK